MHKKPAIQPFDGLRTGGPFYFPNPGKIFRGLGKGFLPEHDSANTVPPCKENGWPDSLLKEPQIMIKKIFFTAVFLLLCSSCVSRTTYKGNSISGSSKPVGEKELIWFWDEDY